MQFEYNHPKFSLPAGDEENYEVHKLSKAQRKQFRELQEAAVKYQANMIMLEKAQIDINFAFSTFWGAVNKDHKLYGRRAIINEELMEVLISKQQL